MLNLLNTKYVSHTITRFEFNNVTLPKNMEKGIFCHVRLLTVDINDMTEVLENINHKNKITIDFNFDIFLHPSLIHFEKFYKSLNNTIRQDITFKILKLTTLSPMTSSLPQTPVMVNSPSIPALINPMRNK
jgi:hypothetical protein